MLMMIAPAKPSIMPTVLRSRGRERISTIAMEVLKIGTRAFSIPARAESMCCRAIGNRRKGTATQVNPRSATRG